jgi:tetratricopeptide (TPR) repeat protein
MAIIKILDFLYLKTKLPAMITLTVVLLNGLVISNSILAKDRSPDILESQFGSYLAGRQAQFNSDPNSAIQYYLSSLKQSPNNIFLLRQIIPLLVSHGKVDEALPKAKQLLKLSNNASNTASLALILADIKNRKYIKAFKDTEKLREEGLNTYLIPMLKAWLLAGQNKSAAALRIIDQKPPNPGLATLHGIQGAMISEFDGNIKDAIIRYKRVVKLQKNINLRAAILLGNLYERLGEKQKAKEIYDIYKSQHPSTTVLARAYKRLRIGEKPKPKPNNKIILDGIAEALFSLGLAVKNQDVYQTIIFSRLAVYLRPSFITAKLLLAGSMEENDNLKDANTVYQTISKDLNYSWAARLRIAHNLDRLGKTDAAIRKLHTMSIEEPKRVDALIKMGDILQRHKRYQASINSYEQAKKKIENIGAEYWPLYFSLGISYERIDKWPMAEKNLLKALELKPNHPSILNYLGYSWVEQGLNLDQAQKMIRSAVKQRPRDGYIIDSLGWALFRLGNIEGAVKQLERAVLIRPEDPTINDHLGDIYWSIGRKNEAIFQWNRALILEPEKDVIPKIKLKLRVGLPKNITKRTGL